MALIPCPECQRQVSSDAPACPSCGYPVSQRTASGQVPSATGSHAEPTDTTVVLREVHPSWWNFGWHIVFFWLIIPIFVALYRRHSFRMRIYPDRVSIAEGFWSKETTEFFIKDIRAIDVKQGFWGRMVGIGDVTISTAATVDAAETAEGVADPMAIKELLIGRRQQLSGAV